MNKITWLVGLGVFLSVGLYEGAPTTARVLALIFAFAIAFCKGMDYLGRKPGE